MAIKSVRLGKEAPARPERASRGEERTPTETRPVSHSLQDVRHALGNQAFGRELRSGAPSAAVMASLGSTVGNQTLQRLIQRKINLPPSYLDGLSTLKARLDVSTWVQIKDKYHEYHKAKSLLAELTLINDMLPLIDAWIGSHAPDANAIKQLDVGDQTKLRLLQSLKTELEAEKPKIVAIERKRELIQTVGIPESYLDELQQSGDYDLLWSANFALGKGDVGAADAALSQLRAKPYIGDTVNMLKTALLRRHIGKINPGLGTAVNNPKFQVTDKATAGLAQQRTQTLADERIAKLADTAKGTDVAAAEKAKIELAALGPQYQDIGKAAGTLQAGNKDLKTLTPAEATAVVGYSSNVYGGFNAPLRSEVGTAKFDPQKLALTQVTVSALNKLKPHAGLSYRHLGVFAGYKELTRVGGTVSDLAFVSTAVLQKACSNAGENHEVLEIVTSKNGRIIAGASLFGPGEAEVLFKPGTRFSVTARFDKQPSGSWNPVLTPDAQMYLDADGKKDKLKMIVFKAEA